MNSLILVKHMGKLSQLFLLLTFGVMNAAQAADTDVFNSSKDGVELSIIFEKSTNAAGIQVLCKITNRNQSDVPFMNTGPTMGLAFNLLGQDGQDVKPKIPWSHIITSQAIIYTEGKRSSKIIKPNESVEFKLALNDAYGDSWQGAKLLIEWIPGDDGSGNPHQIGKGLTTAFDLTGEQPRQIQPLVSRVTKETTLDERQSLPQKSSAPTKTRESKSAPTNPGEEPTTSTPWRIIFILIVAAGGLLWLLLKRRS